MMDDGIWSRSHVSGLFLELAAVCEEEEEEEQEQIKKQNRSQNMSERVGSSHENSSMMQWSWLINSIKKCLLEVFSHTTLMTAYQ